MHVWTQGDWVTRSVLVALVVMSLLSLTVILLKALDVVRARRLAARVEPFWHSADLAEGMSRLGGAEANPFRELALEGREAAAHHRATRAQLHDTLDVSDWISRALQGSIDHSTGRLQAGLAILASVGSTAPFVGLFGTVWGIYHALVAIGMSGSGTLDKVAGPVGEALIMTGLGLAVAIPAVVGYNWLTRANRVLMSRLDAFAYEVHTFVAMGQPLAAADAPPAPPVRAVSTRAA